MAAAVLAYLPAGVLGNPKAAAAYEGSLLIRPVSAVTYRNLGDAYMHLGRKDDARRAYLKAVEQAEEEVSISPNARAIARLAVYQAKAADQSVREIVVQPARGLIVDDMGRPLVANRTSWVVSVDRTLLGKLDDKVQNRLLRRVATAVDRPYEQIEARTLLCGPPGSVAGTCWNGSPYQPVPVG